MCLRIFPINSEEFPYNAANSCTASGPLLFVKWIYLQKYWEFAIKSSVLIIGHSLIKSISFSPFVPTKGAKALHLVQLFVVAVAAVTASC